MVSHCSSSCTAEHTASHLPCHSICGWILPTGYRLMINFLFYCIVMHQTRRVSEQFYPQKMDTWTEKASTIWYNSTCRKWAQKKKKDRGVWAELGCSWTIAHASMASLWVASSQLQSTTAASLDTYFRRSCYLFSAGSREMTWSLPLAWSHNHILERRHGTV